MFNQVIVSLEEAHGLAAEREGVGRVLYDFVAKSPLELSLHKAGVYLFVKFIYNCRIMCLAKYNQLLLVVVSVSCG